MPTKKMLIVISLIIIFAASYRLTDHPQNFAPITAICLLAGAFFRKSLIAIALAFSTIYFSDFIINNFTSKTGFDTTSGFIWFHDYMIVNFLAFATIVAFSWLFLKKRNPFKIVLASLLGSLIFFLVTNAGAWIQLPIYSKDIAGLINSYAAGLPFFRAAVLGDLIFTIVLFGAVYVIQNFVFQADPEVSLSK